MVSLDPQCNEIKLLINASRETKTDESNLDFLDFLDFLRLKVITGRELIALRATNTRYREVSLV